MITIQIADFDKCGVGISTAAEVPLTVGTLRATNTGTVLHVRDAVPNGLLQKLGLPDTTSPHVVVDALEILAAVRNAPIEVQAQALEGSKLVQALGVGADLASIIGVLLSA